MKCMIKFLMVVFPETTELEDILVMSYMTEQLKHCLEIVATQHPLFTPVVNVPRRRSFCPVDQPLFHVCSILTGHGDYLQILYSTADQKFERKALLNLRKLNYGRIPGDGEIWAGLQGFLWYPRCKKAFMKLRHA